MNSVADNSSRSPHPKGIPVLTLRSAQPFPTEHLSSVCFCGQSRTPTTAAPNQSVQLPNKSSRNSLAINGTAQINRYKMPIPRVGVPDALARTMMFVPFALSAAGWSGASRSEGSRRLSAPQRCYVVLRACTRHQNLSAPLPRDFRPNSNPLNKTAKISRHVFEHPTRMFVPSGASRARDLAFTDAYEEAYRRKTGHNSEIGERSVRRRTLTRASGYFTATEERCRRDASV